VRVLGGQEAIAALQMQHQRDDVAHRTRRHPQRRLEPEQPCHRFFQRCHRGVVVEDVVAHFGVGHGFSHDRIGSGDGVGAKVDRSMCHEY